MPPKPRRPCSVPGCPNLTPGRYCEEHTHKAVEQTAARHRYYDRYQRNQKAKDFYESIAWEKTRQAVLIRDKGLCQECLKEKKITPADTVHHIVELREDWGRRLDMDNLVSLCASCHSRIHSRG